jgi:thymidylate synthase
LTYIDTQYEDLLRHVYRSGAVKGDRTGTGTYSVFGTDLRYDLSRGFPLLTTKKVHFKSVAIELLWLLSGDTNIKFMTDNGVTIWNEWADENGDLGPVYGKQWRAWEGRSPEGDTAPIDQIAQVIEAIRNDPNSRRMIVSAWNVTDLPHMALAPCHAFFQFYVARGRLSLKITQRSADMFLGVPFNIASYALLTHMVAHVTGLQVGEPHLVGRGHARLREPRRAGRDPVVARMPLRVPALGGSTRKRRDSIDDFTFDDFTLHGYESWPGIKAPVAV